MARYRKVEVKTWSDGKFRELSAIPPCGQGLWLWFLTGPRTTNIPGVITGTDEVMAAELHWPIEAFREAFREASSKAMAKADWKAGLVWLPNASRAGDKRNKPESPNVIRSWRDTWDEIPECTLKLELWQQLKAFADGFGKGFGEAFKEACRKPWVKAIPNQEQEQKQEQKQEQNSQILSASEESNGLDNGHGKERKANGYRQSLTLEQVAALQEAYPKGVYLQSDWLTVEKLVNAHMDRGVAFERILASFQRYATQQQAKGNIGSQFIRSPAVHCDISRPLFDEPFEVPITKGERRTNANIDVVAQAGRELFGEPQ